MKPYRVDAHLCGRFSIDCSAHFETKFEARTIFDMLKEGCMEGDTLELYDMETLLDTYNKSLLDIYRRTSILDGQDTVPTKFGK